VAGGHTLIQHVPGKCPQGFRSVAQVSGHEVFLALSDPEVKQGPIRFSGFL
jgi:hypothetical protein